MSTYTRSELENSGQCHWKSIGALPLSSKPRVEPGFILIIGAASCAYTICEISFCEIHLMMNSRNIQPAKILRCMVSNPFSSFWEPVDQKLDVRTLQMRQSIIQNYLLLQQSHEEIKLLKEDMLNTVQYYEQKLIVIGRNISRIVNE